MKSDKATTVGGAAIYESNSLCYDCLGITIPSLTEEDPYLHSNNVWDLERSAIDCRLCSLIAAAIVQRKRLNDVPLIEYDGSEFVKTLLSLDCKLGEDMPLFLQFHSNEPQEILEHGSCSLLLPGATNLAPFSRKRLSLVPVGMIMLHCSPGYVDAARMLPNVLPKLEPNSSENAVKMIRSWLEQCGRDHTLCNKLSPRISHPMPTRILDLEFARDGRSVRLIESVGMCAEYATLSHCWGRHQPVRTTSVNIGSHLRRIRLNNLPKTFQDAISVARKLSIQYLWIDSLCIIQDDPQDWKREARRMGNVFANSCCTISATSAKDSTHGLFSQREDLHSVLLEQTNTSSKLKFWASLVSYFTLDVDKGTLNKRAWVLQERMLSSRNVHYSHDKIYWECVSGARTEEGRIVTGHDDLVRDFILSLQDEKSISHRQQRWFNIIQRYTACNITHRSDRLIALSGLISKLEKHWKVRCCAGLWQDTFRHDLLWTAIGELTPLDLDVAPSWSWACTEGPKHYIQHDEHWDFNPDLEVIDIEERAEPSTGGSQTASRWTMTVSARLKEAPDFGHVEEITSLENFGGYADIDIHWAFDPFTIFHALLDDTGLKIGFVVFDRESQLSNGDAKLWCACVAVARHDNSFQSSSDASSPGMSGAEDPIRESPQSSPAKSLQSDSAMLSEDSEPSIGSDDGMISEEHTAGWYTKNRFGTEPRCPLIILRSESEESEQLVRVGAGYVLCSDWFENALRVVIKII